PPPSGSILYPYTTLFRSRPPLGLFGRVRTEEGFLDLKRHALAPIVSLARVYALMAGSPARRTPERLKQGAEKGALSLELAERLEDRKSTRLNSSHVKISY